MKIRAFKTHKQSESDADCQDAYCINRETRSLAVSDGMSQSIFQTFWAEILTRYFVNNADLRMNEETVKELSDEWREKVDKQVQRYKDEGRPVWMTENMLNNGHSAGATFLGVRLNDGLKYDCQVLGDSCLIVVGDDYKIEDIVTSQEGQFDSYPDYYDSDKTKNGKGKLKERTKQSMPSKGLLMVSDPFSDFLQEIRGTDDERKRVGEMFAVRTKGDFIDLVDAFRQRGMHDDDSTLIIIENDGNDSFDYVEETENTSPVHSSEIKVEDQTTAQDEAPVHEQSEVSPPNETPESVDAGKGHRDPEEEDRIFKYVSQLNTKDLACFVNNIFGRLVLRMREEAEKVLKRLCKKK